MPVKEISRKYPKPISSQSSLEITFNFFCSDWKCVFLWQFASLIPMKWGIASFCHSFAQIKNILLYDFFVNPFPNVFFSSIPYVYTPTNTNVQKTTKDLNVGWYCKVWLLKRIVCHDVTMSYNYQKHSDPLTNCFSNGQFVMRLSCSYQHHYH